MIRRLIPLLALLSLAGCAAHAPDRSAPREAQKTDDDAVEEDRLSVEREVERAGARAPSIHTAPSSEQAPEAAPPRDAPVEAVQAAEDAGGVDVEGDTWEQDDPRAELDELVKELGEQLDEARKDGVTQNQLPGALRCEEVCELSEGVCTSSEKICRIAQRHPAEPYFADRCAWSGRECTQASERCQRCAPR